MSQYDKIEFKHIGAGQTTPNLEERVNAAIDEALRSLQQPGAGPKAKVAIAIEIKTIRDQSSGDIIRFDVSGQPKVTPATMPGCSTIAFPGKDGEVLTSASRQGVIEQARELPLTLRAVERNG